MKKSEEKNKENIDKFILPSFRRSFKFSIELLIGLDTSSIDDGSNGSSVSATFGMRISESVLVRTIFFLLSLSNDICIAVLLQNADLSILKDVPSFQDFLCSSNGFSSR